VTRQYFQDGNLKTQTSAPDGSDFLFLCVYRL
jgi:hypothetical protein